MKILDMAYSVMNDALPVGSRFTRGAFTPCPVCGGGSDDLPHVLFTCPAAAPLWGWAVLAWRAWQVRGERPARPPPVVDMGLWLSWVLDRASAGLSTAEWLAWSVPVLKTLWGARNVAYFQHSYPTQRQLRLDCIQRWCDCARDSIMLHSDPVTFFSPIIQISPGSGDVSWLGPPDPP
jgi:hypothetical protein